MSKILFSLSEFANDAGQLGAMGFSDSVEVDSAEAPDRYASSSVHQAQTSSRGRFPALRRFQKCPDRILIADRNTIDVDAAPRDVTKLSPLTHGLMPQKSPQGSESMQALEISGGLIVGRNNIRTKKVDGLHALDGVGGDDDKGDVQRILDEWFEETIFKGGTRTLSREVFLARVQESDWNEWRARLPHSFETQHFALKSRWGAQDKIISLALVPAEGLKESNGTNYQHIYLDVSASGIIIVGAAGNNYDQTYAALVANPSATFSESTKPDALAAWLDAKSLGRVLAIHKNGKRHDLDRTAFQDLLAAIDFTALFAQLQVLRPDWLVIPVSLVLRSHWDKQVGSMGIISSHDAGPVRRPYQFIHLEVSQSGIAVVGVEGIRDDQSYTALLANSSARFSETAKTAAIAAWLDAKIFKALPRPKNSDGRSPIDREVFLDLLQKVPFEKLFLELQALRPDLLESPLSVAIKSIWKGKDGIGGMTVVFAGDLGQANGDYQHVRLEISQDSIRLVGVDGSHKDLALTQLVSNPHLSIHPFLLAQQNVSRAEEMLLLRLSEFGRTLLHNEIRRLEISRGISLSDTTLAVDTETVHEAALNVLVGLGHQFVNERDAGDAWQPDDQRFAVAQTLGRFVTVPMSREDAGAVSALLVTALLREQERALGEYARVTRLAGDSPIAESGWDNVYSPELRTTLREFAAVWFATGDVANPAADYLRDPFNEVVGAYYYHLYQGDHHTDQRFEILAHLFYQQRRGDDLKHFYDGMIKASGLDEDSVHAAIRQEFKAYAAQRSEWQLDNEEPTRLVDGLMGGAARFVWDKILSAKQHQMMVQMAREIFSQHVSDFSDDTNPAEILPQALFFEVLGKVAHTLVDNWIANTGDRNFENSIALLNTLAGLGDESAWGFRRGFGNDILVRETMQAITDYLMQHHDEAFRNWLEGVVEYSVNQIQDGTYTTKIVQIRRADLLARLMTGYSLRNHVLVLQRFRLNNLTERQELEKAQGIWQKIQNGVSDPVDKKWLYQILNRWTAPKTGARLGGATVGERWYLIEQWVTQNGTDLSGKFLDVLLKEIVTP